MKHDNFERKNNINTPYLNRARVILLKQAICQAENDVLSLIGKGAPMNRIDQAVGNIRDAKFAVKMALQDGFLGNMQLHRIELSLHQAAYQCHRDSIWYAINLAFDLFELMPAKAPQLRGVPYYRLTDKTRAVFATTIPNHNQPENAAEAAMSNGGAK